MKIRRYSILALMAACASGAPPSGPAPGGAALLHAAPETGTTYWVVADSTSISMDMNGQAMSVRVEFEGGLHIDYAGGDPMEATVTFDRVNGAFANPIAGTTQLSPRDMPGPARLTVARNGRTTMVTTPEMTSALRQVIGSAAAYSRLFVRVPGRVVQPGTMWTDTVDTDANAAGMRTTAHEVIRSTFTGDTMVAGRRLNVIQSSIESTIRVSGETGGVEVRQTLDGDASAVTLWDPQRGLVFERIEHGNSYGSMELPSMGVAGVPVSAATTRRLRLADRS